MKDFIIAGINLYQKYLSPDQSVFSRGRKFCNFEPTCSEYIKKALFHGGVFYALKKGLPRIISCYPFKKISFDPFRP